MRRALVATVLAGALLAVGTSTAGATPRSACAPPNGAASSTRTGCTAPVPMDPIQAAYALLKTRLGGDIARALDAEQTLNAALDSFASTEYLLTGQVTQEEDVISGLEDQIARLDQQIADTEDRIDVEKGQLATMSRAIYRHPDSFWILIARTGNLHEALMATADAIVAGQRAHALQVRLEADLASLHADRQARQDDLDREQGTLDLLNANLSSLQDVESRESDVSSELQDLISQIQSAMDTLTNQPPDVIDALAALLESQEADLIQRSYETAWTAAQVGAGVALVNHSLPVGKPIQGLSLQWPMVSFTITQAFGPTSVTLEPAYGPYKHFHTGIDIAAPLGTPVMAAADGLVVAVGHGNTGYGNFVVVAHGGGVATLYGHLLRTDVTVGARVARGQLIGREGSTGFSTGPHVHFELRVDNQVINPMPYLPVPGTNWAG